MSEKLPAPADRSPASLVTDALTISGKPANRMILLGDPKWVKGTIHRLHSLGIAEVGTRKQVDTFLATRENSSAS
jgi:hypothetical protein